MPSNPIAVEERSLLSEVPGALADLYRADSLFSVQVVYLPSLDQPEAAHVAIFVGKELLDELTLTAEDGIHAFTHPASFSNKLLELLRKKKSS